MGKIKKKTPDKSELSELIVVSYTTIWQYKCCWAKKCSGPPEMNEFIRKKSVRT